MTASHHTRHYGLSQYAQDDRPTYTGDYNGDMSKIDAAIYAASPSRHWTRNIAMIMILFGQGRLSHSNESEEPHHE